MALFGSPRKRHGLYYLLPGMNRGNREKRRRFFRWSVLVGLLTAGALASILWLFNR